MRWCVRLLRLLCWLGCFKGQGSGTELLWVKELLLSTRSLAAWCTSKPCSKLKRKENSSRATPSRNPSHKCYHWNIRNSSLILKRFPFCFFTLWKVKSPNVNLSIRTDSLIAVRPSYETIIHFRLQASWLEYYRLPPRSALMSASAIFTDKPSTRTSRTPTPFTILKKKGHGFGPQVSTVNFRRIRIMMVSCYTLLSEYPLPRPSTICLDSDTAFTLMTCEFGALTGRLVQSTSPILLTKRGPLSFPFCYWV